MKPSKEDLPQEALPFKKRTHFCSLFETPPSTPPTSDCQLKPLDLTVKTERAERTDSPPTYRCDECQRNFLIYDRYTAHLRRHRIKASGRYTCEMCNKSFVQQSSLITHERIHTGERPYHCTVCNNSYGDLSTFTKHKRTHTGDKPYACRFCNRRFSQSGNCLRHARSVHGDHV